MPHKPLCIVDTCSLIYLSGMELARRPLHRWLFDEFDVVYSQFVWVAEIQPQLDKIDQNDRRLIQRKGNQLEDLIYFQSRQYRPFTQGLRDLTDRLPNYLTLLMNFTLATGTYEDATVVLGDALTSRITHQVYFNPLTPDEAYEYVLELMGYYRSDDPANKGLPPTYPFTEDALRTLIEMLPPLGRTPRDLNKQCSQVVSQALIEGVITAPGEGIITPEFVAKVNNST